MPCSDVTVKCPFYNGSTKTRVTSEGIQNSRSKLIWEFQDGKARDQQMEIFCCKYYKNCEVYRMIMEANY